VTVMGQKLALPFYCSPTARRSFPRRRAAVAAAAMHRMPIKNKDSITAHSANLARAEMKRQLKVQEVLSFGLYCSLEAPP